MYPYGGYYNTYEMRWLSQLYGGYGSRSLTESSPPQFWTEPLDVAAVTSYLKLPVRRPPDDAEDADLSMMIAAARSVAEILQNRVLVRKQLDVTFNYWPGYQIELQGPVVSVDLVRYRDSTGAYTSLVENTGFVVDTSRQPGVLTPLYNQTWPTFTPWGMSSVLVRYTAGYAADSAFWNDGGPRIKLGMKRLVNEWFCNRLPFGLPVEEMPFGVTDILSFGAVPRVA